MLNFSSNSKGLSDRTGVVGDKYNGYFLGIVEGSTKCPLKYGTIKSAFGNSSSDCSLVDIGADPCCNTYDKEEKEKMRKMKIHSQKKQMIYWI
jgi:hypothetical protein